MGSHEEYSDPNYLYGTHFKVKADPERCRWGLFKDYQSYQCHNKHSVDGLWCRIHSPEAKKKRAEKFQASYEAKIKKWDEQNRQRRLKEKAVAALEEIAKGELNDPVGYAIMILEE